jgi:hypothetical protein
MKIRYCYRIAFVAAALALATTLIPSNPVSAEGPTTSVTIRRMAADGVTVNREVTLTYQEMEERFEVYGDGETHYYHQGPTFNPDDLWDQNETLPNDTTADMGAVKGTNLIDLCNEAGGMVKGEEATVIGNDGWNWTFAWKNIYKYSDREGPIVLTWYKNGMFPDSGYDEGMRLVWFADTSNNIEGNHVFGNWDWHEAVEEDKYIYRHDNIYPSAKGLSGKTICQIAINSHDPPFWDINGDKKCALEDMRALGLKWGEEGEEGWIPEDVNRDGMVNVLDAVKLGMYWGKSY